MVVFAYSFYGKQISGLDISSEIETDRSSSPRLYRMMLRSVASRGGGPGSRWTYFRDSSRHWNARASPNSSIMAASSNRTHIYEWNHLSYEGASPLTTFMISTTKATYATGTVLRTTSLRELLYIEELDPLMHLPEDSPTGSLSKYHHE